MIIKLLSITMMVLIVLTTACANSGDKWSHEQLDKGDSVDSGWKQNPATTDDRKKTSSSYWEKEGRY
ncbi:hypothetical protein [Kaarinaea lacus]